MKNFLFSILTLFAFTAFGASTSNKTISFVDGISSTRSYILNGNFQNQGIKGWATYKNTAQALPVTGTGGSPTHITINRTTSSPLRGSGSLQIVNSGSTSAQGEGASYDFSIDTADQGQAMQATFNFAIVSGTFVPGTDTTTGDLNVYLYDVTNSQVIQPVGFKIVGSVSGQQYVQLSSFQAPSNSTSLRFIFQVAGTNTSAWTINVASIQVGPSIKSMAPIITPWVAFTPTGDWTTNTTYLGQWRRVGDSMEVQVSATLAGAPSSGAFYFILPGGYVMDTTKLTSANGGVGYPTIGQGQGVHSGTQYNFQLIYAGSNVIEAVYQSAITGVLSSVTQTAPVTWGAGDVITATLNRIPIVGWSSNTQISNEAGPLLVSAQYNGQPTGTLSGTFNAATYPTKIVDTTNSYSGSTYTVAQPGNYDVAAQLAISATYIAANRAGIAIYINGVQKYTQLLYAGSVSTSEMIPQISVKSIPLNSGDTVVIRSFCEGSSPTFDSSADRNYFSIARVANPAPILVNSPVAVSAYATGNLTLAPNNTVVKVNLNTVAANGATGFDSTGSYDTTNFWFKAPRAGFYYVSGFIELLSTNILANTYEAQIFVNASFAMAGQYVKPVAANPIGVNVSGLLKLNAGDTVDLRMFGAGNNSSSNVTAFTTTYMTVNSIN